jgi:hypothetical protein
MMPVDAGWDEGEDHHPLFTNQLPALLSGEKVTAEINILSCPPFINSRNYG